MAARPVCADGGDSLPGNYPCAVRFKAAPRARRRTQQNPVSYSSLLDVNLVPSTVNAERSTPRIAALALGLCDMLIAAGDLPPRARRLLDIAVGYYLAARRAGADQPHRAGRDAVLAAELDGLDDEARCLAASIVAFQRTKLHPERETAFLRLDDDDQALVLRLAGLLALADALDEHGPLDVRALRGPERLVLIIGGAAADGAIAAVQEQADRWRQALGPVAIVPGDAATATALGARLLPQDGLVTEVDPGALNLPGGLRGDEPLAEGARRVLRRMFERMLAREEEVRRGEDPEDVHQMRVATRRLRASLQVVEPIYTPKPIRRFRRQLRRVARALGEVRDRDVFLEHIRAAAVPPDPALTAQIEEERAAARRDLLDSLDSTRYRDFKHEFARFLTTPGAAAGDLPPTGLPLRVRDLAGSMVWRRYEDWRAFEVVVPGGPDETLHLARIAGKRLRYTLEFFAEAFGPRVEAVLAPLAALQENLGALQDAVVARAYVRARGLDGHPATAAYLAAREAERATYLADLPRLWKHVDCATYRRRLYELIIRL